jgi:ABC-type sugar transport system ATPase subunit
MAFENYALYPTLSVYENLAFPARAAHWPNDRIDKRVREVASIAAIDKLLDRRTGELSSGQAQMVGLARALVREPAVFLLDEPISHVDARLRIDMRTYIKRLQVELGYTMVLVTHDQEDAMALADRIAVMADGRLRQLGTPAEVYDRPEDTFVANFIGSPPINLFDCQIGQAGGTTVLRRDGLTFDLPDQFLPLAAAGTLPASVTVGIRPFHLTAGAGAGHGAIAARVVVVEPLGDMEIVTAEAASLPIQVVIPPGNRPKRDETMQLALEPEYVLLFDRESKQAIHAPSDDSATARAAAARV